MKNLFEVGAFIEERYLLKQLLGRGGTTDVYEGADFASSAHERVVLKCLDPVFKDHPEAAQLLVHEENILRALQHPGIVSLYETSHASQDFIVLHYVEGISLKQALMQPAIYLSAKGLSESVKQQLVAVIEYLHSQDVVHADLKPSNLILSSSGRLTLVDFSFARYYRNEALHAPIFEARDLIAYTPRYASPSVCAGNPAMPEDDGFAVQKILELF